MVDEVSRPSGRDRLAGPRIDARPSRLFAREGVRRVVAGSTRCSPDAVRRARRTDRRGSGKDGRARPRSASGSRAARARSRRRRAGQVWMADGVRADLHASLGERAKLVPVHRRELFRMRGGLVGELRHVERRDPVRVTGAGEHRRRHAAAVRAPAARSPRSEGIVEGDVHSAADRAEQISRRHTSEAAPQEAAKLALEVPGPTES